jgi:hypothetical protein
MYPSPQKAVGDNLFSVNTVVPGIVRISDNCVIVNLLPYCSFKIGKRAADGHLLDGMREHLDDLDVYDPGALP